MSENATMNADNSDSMANKEPPTNVVSFKQPPPSEKKDGKLDEMLARLEKKEIVLRHDFKSISSLEESVRSDLEEHFGFKWYINVRRVNDYLACYLHCPRDETNDKISIETKLEIKACGSKNIDFVCQEANHCFVEMYGFGFATFQKWDDIKKNYLIDDSLKIEIHVLIKKTTEVHKESLGMFDESRRDVSDIVVVMDDEKFYVSKLYLAFHSSYFKSLFLGKFKESGKSALIGTDPYDFHNYLKVLYGESAINELTVEGILLMAGVYDTPLIIRKCETFLMEKSTKELKKKLQMSLRYRLESLKSQCLDEIQSMDVLRSVITPAGVDDLDPQLMALLFKKSLSFQ